MPRPETSYIRKGVWRVACAAVRPQSAPMLHMQYLEATERRRSADRREASGWFARASAADAKVALEKLRRLDPELAHQLEHGSGLVERRRPGNDRRG